MSGTEGEDSMERSYCASSGGEIEVVSEAILGKPSIGRFRELGFKDVLVGVIPGEIGQRHSTCRVRDLTYQAFARA